MVDYLYKLYRLYMDNKVARSAAASSYYLTLSFFPFLICLQWLIGAFNLEIVNLLEPLESFIPLSTRNLVYDYLNYIGDNDSFIMLVGALMFMITSSSSAFGTIYIATSDLLGRHTNFGMLRFLFYFACSSFFLLATFLALALSLISDTIFNTLMDFIPYIETIDQSLIRAVSILRFSGQFLFMVCMLYLLYRFKDKALNKGGKVFKVAMISSLMLVGLSIGFSHFMQSSVRYSLVYGSLASVIALMTWIYFSVNIIIFGSAIINLNLDTPKIKRFKF